MLRRICPEDPGVVIHRAIIFCIKLNYQLVFPFLCEKILNRQSSCNSLLGLLPVRHLCALHQACAVHAADLVADPGNSAAGNIIKIASVLGIFQAGMTVIGYTMGLGFEKYICAFDHWIAFTLLLYLGGKMIYDSTKEEEEDGKFDPLCNRTLCGLGIATSIDALAVGISLAILKSPLLLQASTIGVVTFAISAFGVYFGNRFGKRIDLKLDLIGGLILIGIGTKILIEHLFFS